MTEEELLTWCNEHAKNGISQHGDKWLEAKLTTVGGSSLAIFDGSNSFTTLPDYVAMKLGLSVFQSDIKPQWGNLFEEVIKLEVEKRWKCTVYGEDLYIVGKHYGTSYSPDGLAIIDGTPVLFEFKCPYSRIPGKLPPAYYIPQVKMGLCLLELPKYGIYVEAVYRRCSWSQLGPGPGFDRTLVDRPATGSSESYGFIGFYTTPEQIGRAIEDIGAGKIQFIETTGSTAITRDNPIGVPRYLTEYRRGNAMNDIGISTPILFKNLMILMDKGYISAWYGRVHDESRPGRANVCINEDLERYKQFCGESSRVNYGILPWKLLRLEWHKIEYEPTYLDSYLPNITKVIDFVKSALPLDVEEKKKELSKFVEEYYRNDTIIDEYDDGV
jgi:hypothetical protein